ncbi:hypothetical protein [Thiocapsa marina]|uniref:Uncharacterized protein n=1 Tax=Thiocapsa marina 5811 TaxID=768671 RepID=F9U6Y0_9GAMM|nr:hypothetical protein [Thiocapsa marina]EGV20006.1 hypothetical protein ThimaDRAFT_0682 [Thiocapsa marina 5811]
MDPAVSAQIADALHTPFDGGEPVAASPADWGQAAPRVARYLRALGVRDRRDSELLMARIRDRFEHRVETNLVASAVETGIEEASDLLDEWLATELGSDVPGPMRGVARAVVLSGAVPGWVGVWSGRTPQHGDQSGNRPIGERIRAGSLAPVPDLAPLSMVTQRIDPCCYRLFRRLARRLRWARSGSIPGSVQRRQANRGRSV